MSPLRNEGEELLPRQEEMLYRKQIERLEETLRRARERADDDHEEESEERAAGRRGRRSPDEEEGGDAEP